MSTDDFNAWWNLGGAMVVMFLSTGIVQTFGFLYESTREELKMKLALFTWAFNVGITLQFVFCIGVCRMLECMSHRTLLSIGGFMVSAGVFISSFATAPWHMFIFFSILIGTGTGLTTQTAYLLINKHFSARRGLAIGLLYSTAPLARTILPTVEKALEEKYGNRGALLFMSGIMLNIIPAAVWIRKFQDISIPAQLYKTAIDPDKKVKSMEEESSRQWRDSFWDTAKKLMRAPIFWIFLIADSFFWLLFPNFTMLLPLYVAENEDENLASWLMIFTGCGDLLARLTFPPLIDRSLLHPRNGYVMGNVFGMIAAGIMPFVRKSFWGLGISTFLYGVGSGTSVCFGGLVLLHYFGLDNLPISTGIGWTIKGLVLLVLGPLIGGLKDLTGDFSATYFLLSGGMALGTVIWTLEPVIEAWRTKMRPSFSVSVVDVELSVGN